MILGYSTNAFVEFSLQDAIGRIARLGFRGVEIMCDTPHLYPPDFNAPRLAGLKELIDSNGLQVTNLNSFTLFAVGDTYLPSWIEPQAARREIRIQHTLACLKIADQLGCKNISIPPGGPLGNMSRKEAFVLFHQGLDRVIPLAEELGVKILVEPEPDLLMERTEEFLGFIQDVRSPAVGLNFDIGHFYCAGEDPCRAIETLFQWIGHMHVEDIAPSRIHHHLIAGHGVIGFLDIFKRMAALGYQGDISLELYPYTDKPEAAGRESLAFLRPLFDQAGLGI